MARPRKEINLETLRSLASIQCTYPEMAAILNVSVRYLKMRYCTKVEKWKSEGTCSLRRKMWLSAMNGNTTMQIWVSKNEMGWSDRREVTMPGGLPVRIKTAEEVAKEIEEAAAKEAAELKERNPDA